MKEIAVSLTSQVIKSIENINPRVINHFDDFIHSHERIFVVGAGRSGLVGKFFGMRLMHIGKSVHIVGETLTPRINEGSILIAISGSGETSSVISVCKKAKESNAKIVLFTSSEKSALSAMSDLVIKVEGPAEKPQNDVNVMPMGTFFEITTLILLESSIGKSIFNFEITENELKLRHTNLE
ncbi:MAG: SIS domain-containing protein [Deltaproteobacteria bacterium]|nr:SIS domain-containing protein [Deltaproteobacteria bacterium]